MKKALFLFIVSASFFLSAHAQVRFGIKAGYNYANISGPDARTNKPMSGFHAGILANLPVIGNFDVQPEIMYSLQGARFDDGPSAPDHKLTLHYINIPVLAKLTTPSGFLVETGPQYGILLGAKEKTGSDEEDVKQYLRNSDFSWVLGVGYLINPGIALDIRYNYGLTEVGKEGRVDARIKNSVFQAGLRIKTSGTKK